MKRKKGQITHTHILYSYAKSFEQENNCQCPYVIANFGAGSKIYTIHNITGRAVTAIREDYRPGKEEKKRVWSSISISFLKG